MSDRQLRDRLEAAQRANQRLRRASEGLAQELTESHRRLAECRAERDLLAARLHADWTELRKYTRWSIPASAWVAGALVLAFLCAGCALFANNLGDLLAASR